VLTDADAQRLGLPPIQIGYLTGGTPRNPEPLAMVNLVKVRIGDLIPRSSARVAGISARGIAIEVDGEHFFVPR
jgi:hypothetical protein